MSPLTYIHVLLFSPYIRFSMFMQPETQQKLLSASKFCPLFEHPSRASSSCSLNIIYIIIFYSLQLKMKVIIFILVLFCVNTSQTYKNPTQGSRDSPDPGVTFDGSYFYAATTGGQNEKYFPIWQSMDLTEWKQVGWGMTKQDKPGWATSDFWAPEIHIFNNLYFLYYTARDKSGKLCIGVGYSVTPQGPYIHDFRPLLKEEDQGVIDATIYIDKGKIYLIYKVDGNAHGNPTPIYAVQLSSDGLSVKGQKTFLIRDSLDWQRGIVEAPWVIYEKNYFYLFYSSCGYNNKCYSVGVARSKNLLGPYEKQSSPILHTRTTETSQSWEGPGHCSVLKTRKGNYAIVYHAWPHDKIGSKRLMMLDEMKWDKEGWPVIHDGSPSQKQMPIF